MTHDQSQSIANDVSSRGDERFSCLSQGAAVSLDHERTSNKMTISTTNQAQPTVVSLHQVVP